MLVMVLFFGGAILLEGVSEILGGYIMHKMEGYIPRRRRGYPRVKSLVD